MTKVLYAVSPIGLGHASRAVAVGLKLGREGVQLEFATGGRAVAFLQSYGFTTHDIVTEPTPSEKDGVMRYPAIWYIRYWSGYRSTKKKMAGLVSRTEPGMVVGDEEFSSVSIALERNLKHALISDELELGFARSAVSRYIERRVSRWYTNLQESVSSVLVPDIGKDYKNVHFVSPVVRERTSNREESLKRIGIEGGSRLVLLSASGSGIGDFLLKSTLDALDSPDLRDVRLVVSGLQGQSREDKVTYLGMYRDNQDLVAAADLVISTAGKSTIDEAQSFGSPIIAIPIKNHVEQERNAASLGFKHEDILRMKELIVGHIGKRTAPRDYSGADVIAAYLLNAV